MALKLVHTADWHLGKRFPGFSETQQNTLTRARLDVLDKVFGEADKCAADAVLCAGDLFDEPAPSPVWWEGLLKRLSKTNPQRKIFLLPGNHDPLLGSSVWAQGHAFRVGLPKHVYVVERKNSEFELGPNAVLYASPCQSQAGQEDLALALPAREPGDTRIRIGMVHGSTFDIPGFQTNFPIAQDAAVRRGLDYLAVGDTHAFRMVPPGAVVPTVYPSAPEPTTFAEREAGYLALVFIRTSRTARVERVAVANWRWEEACVRSLDELRGIANRPDLSRCVLRLAVEMRVPAAEYEEAEQLLVQLAGTEADHPLVGVLALDRSGLRLDTNSVAQVLAGMPEAVRAAAERLMAQQHAHPQAVERALYHLYSLSRQEL